MTNHPNRSRTSALFQVFEATGFDTRTNTTTFEVVASAKSQVAAVRKMQAHARRKKDAGWAPAGFDIEVRDPSGAVVRKFTSL
jgi:hypothetical protein